MADFDTIIQNGHVIDCLNNVDEITDVAIKDGKIALVSPNIKGTCVQRIDASGCLIVPGLIDCHVHVYEYSTTLGANADQTCLARGVTTVVDAGSSGCMTFAGLRKYICEQSHTRVLAFLNIACHGLAGAGCSGEDFGPGGENDHIHSAKLKPCIDCCVANNDIIVGIKVRLDRNITDNGRNELEVFSRAQMAASSCKLPLMVHHTNSTLDLASSDTALISCPGSLKKGDIYTHTFHGHASTIYVENDIHPSIIKCQAERGILFDVGHGQGSFDWKVAKAAAQRGFWPDLISTDLHSGNVHGAAKDLCYVMTKFLSLGMPLNKIIEAVTASPAKALNRQSLLGSLTVGTEADVTMLKVVHHPLDIEDSFGVKKSVKKAIVPKAVWRAGKAFPIASRDHDP